jgi:hypothetical protein
MKVFVSFAQRDHRLVHALSGALVERGMTPFVATQRLSPGSRLDEKVRDMIRDSDCVVVLNTPNASRSRWVQQEIGCVKALGKHLVPLKTRQSRLAAMLEGHEYYQFKASDPRADFARVALLLRDFAREKGISVDTGSAGDEVGFAERYLLHLPHAMTCPRCRTVDVHVFVCPLCGKWICPRCGETIPPSSRADAGITRKKTRISSRPRGTSEGHAGA